MKIWYTKGKTKEKKKKKESLKKVKQKNCKGIDVKSPQNRNKILDEQVKVVWI